MPTGPIFYIAVTGAVLESDNIGDLFGKLAQCCHHWFIEFWGCDGRLYGLLWILFPSYGFKFGRGTSSGNVT